MPVKTGNQQDHSFHELVCLQILVELGHQHRIRLLCGPLPLLLFEAFLPCQLNDFRCLFGHRPPAEIASCDSITATNGAVKVHSTAASTLPPHDLCTLLVSAPLTGLILW